MLTYTKEKKQFHQFEGFLFRGEVQFKQDVQRIDDMRFNRKKI